MSKKRKQPDVSLRPEDCTTEQLRREYSQQQYEKWQAMSELESLDSDNWPSVTADWHHPEYWIMAARADEQKARLLKRESKRQLSRMLYKK